MRLFFFLFYSPPPPVFPSRPVCPLEGDRSKARLEVFDCREVIPSIKAAPLTTVVPILPPVGQPFSSPPAYRVLARLALWLLLRTFRCRLVTSSLICSAHHPEPGPWRGASREEVGPEGSFPSSQHCIRSRVTALGEFGCHGLILGVLFPAHAA